MCGLERHERLSCSGFYSIATYTLLISFLHNLSFVNPYQLPRGFLGIKVRSKSSKTKWSKECIKHFKYLTSGHQLVAKVTSGHTSYRPNQTSRVFVELYDTSDPSKDISIAQELIKLELAETMPS